MKFNSDKAVTLASIFLLIYANYYAILNSVLPGSYKYIYIAFFTLLGLSPYFFFHKSFNKKELGVLVAWTLVIFEMLLNRNQDIINGNLFFLIRAICGILIIFMFEYGSNWVKKSVNVVVKVGYLNVIATFFFLILPDLYSIMISFYGTYPTGTDQGQAGYRAGIANHYSQNGTFISFVFLALACVWLYHKTEAHSKNIKNTILLVLSLVALVLTLKRAHCLFCILALCIVYFIANPKQIWGRAFKIIILVFLGIAGLYLSSYFIPPVAELLQRFSTAGEDSETLARFKMWNLALKNFLQHPIFGIGWGGFKYEYAAHLYQSWQSESFMHLNAHNVYIQLLCETGIVGLALYLFAVIKSLKITAGALVGDKILEPWKRIVLYMSVTFQIFVLLYNFTGNTLYDYTVYFYAFAVASGLAVARTTHKRIGGS